LPELLVEASNIRQELASLQQPFSQLNAREKKIPAVPWAVIAGVLLFLAVGCGVAWWQQFYFVLMVSLAGVSSALMLGWGGWRQVCQKKAQADCDKERNQLELKKATAQQRQADLSERCSALGLPSSAIDLVRMQKLVSTHRELLDRYWADGEQHVVDSGPELDHEVDACESEPAVSGPVSAEDEAAQELRQLEERMNEFSAQLAEKESRLKELTPQFETVHKETPTGGKPQGMPLHKRKRELEERIAVLRKAVNLLADAVDEFSRSHLTRLNSEASKMFAKVTGGRYASLKLDDEMRPLVQVDSKRWTPVDHFSRGTVDAIYLALRMALAKVRDDGRSLPLMLDDPFVHLDQGRLAKTLNLIDLASADGQLILFSHNLDLGKRAARERWHVIPLDAGSEDNNTEEGGDHAGQLHLLENHRR